MPLERCKSENISESCRNEGFSEQSDVIWGKEILKEEIIKKN